MSHLKCDIIDVEFNHNDMELKGLEEGFQRIKGKVFPIKIAPSEIPKTPEEQVAEIVSRVETVFEKGGRGTREKGKRWGLCGLASDLVKRGGEQKGIPVKRLQNLDVHKKFGIGGDENDSFRHAFNAAAVEGKNFLIDVSCCQFFKENGEIRQGNTITGEMDQHPIAKELLDKGFIELTDETLRKFLAMTTSVSDKTYLNGATVSTLMRDASLELGYEHPDQQYLAQLDNLLSGKETLYPL